MGLHDSSTISVSQRALVVPPGPREMLLLIKVLGGEPVGERGSPLQDKWTSNKGASREEKLKGVRCASTGRKTRTVELLFIRVLLNKVLFCLLTLLARPMSGSCGCGSGKEQTSKYNYHNRG
jgi:hypothetical protein